MFYLNSTLAYYCTGADLSMVNKYIYVKISQRNYKKHIMIDDKITVTIQEMAKVKEKLKGVKKHIKQEEKMENQDYLDLKRTYKDLRSQLKDMEDSHMEELKSDGLYHQLREERLELEEKFANESEKLYELIEKLPKKPFEKKLETEEGFTVVQVMPEMRLYLNGREHRRL
jgi:hypothetical protein